MRNNHENNIFLIQQGHGYIANIDRILMLNEKIEYEVLSNYKKINFDDYDKVYLVTFNLNQIGPLREFLTGTNIFNEFKIERFSISRNLNLQLVIQVFIYMKSIKIKKCFCQKIKNKLNMKLIHKITL